MTDELDSVALDAADLAWLRGVRAARDAYCAALAAREPTTADTLDQRFDLDLVRALRDAQRAAHDLRVASERRLQAQHVAELQALTANLADQLRNPLNAAKLQLELVSRRLRRHAGDHRLVAATDVAHLELLRLSRVLDRFLATPFEPGPDREPARVMHLPRNILVPTDFSDNATVALDYAVALAAKLDARVHLLHVVGPPIIVGDFALDPSWPGGMMSGVSDDAQLELDRLMAARARAAAFGPATLRTGDPQGVIHATAIEVNADLIVMGSHGRRGLSRLLLGSVAESVARTAACPVLLVRVGAST